MLVFLINDADSPRDLDQITETFERLVPKCQFERFTDFRVAKLAVREPGLVVADLSSLSSHIQYRTQDIDKAIHSIISRWPTAFIVITTRDHKDIRRWIDEYILPEYSEWLVRITHPEDIERAIPEWLTTST